MQQKHPFILTLTKYRYQLNLGQEDVAKKMKTQAAAIARFEKGSGNNYHSPKLSTLEAYAKALGGRIEYKFIMEKK